ncbi:KDP operon transcriptional regulatory protein KdpE [bioreactor metagenome]|uniref:KDP operon transcriptional regulatory protein KdpE n=1 Tax=bioreactor metagenome TaxID=1076179 RepID=A0A645IM52_9ZZZZ
MDGVEIIRRVRTWSTLPIIIVSARSNDKDKVLALDEGADDYLTKPFSVEELLARLRVAWRRVSQESNLLTEIQSTFQNGPLHIDYSSRIVTLDQQEVHLTPIEYNLLTLLSRNIGKVLTHNTILKEVWQNYLPNDTPSLRVFMATLRKKIDISPSGSKMIQTHVGVGYRMIRVDDTDTNN